MPEIPPTVLDLDAIKARDYQRDRNGVAAYRQSDLAAVDVPTLVAEVERLRKERDGLREQVHRVKTVRVWTNEDGKRFVFVDDLVAAVDGGESR